MLAAPILFFKGFQRAADRVLEMSQSLNRIRSLVSEIEQIQKQGQRVSRAAPRFDLSAVPAESESFPEPKSVSDAGASNSASIEKVVSESLEPRTEASAEAKQETGPVARAELALENRVMVQWSGNLVLELVLPQNAEKIELKQIGDWIEIRFSDGKAFHIPFKAVA
jgi:hypothetical protein